MLREALAVLAVGCTVAWLGGCGFDPWGWLFRGPELVLSPSELSQYTGTEGSRGLYLAILGQIFDVQQGRKHYGPGGSYSCFSGKDASRAFATGDFTPAGLVDDVEGLSPFQMLDIQKWLSFYHKNYVFVGKVTGRFYNANGTPTETLMQARAFIEEGQRLQTLQEEKKKKFPPCNSEWSTAGGSRVWCSKHSGGVHRAWSGVPRKLYEPGSSQSHCVCVNAQEPPLGTQKGDSGHPNLQKYEGCHPLAESCVLKD